jgi:hypothetical protein
LEHPDINLAILSQGFNLLFLYAYTFSGKIEIRNSLEKSSVITTLTNHTANE